METWLTCHTNGLHFVSCVLCRQVPLNSQAEIRGDTNEDRQSCRAANEIQFRPAYVIIKGSDVTLSGKYYVEASPLHRRRETFLTSAPPESTDSSKGLVLYLRTRQFENLAISICLF